MDNELSIVLNKLIEEIFNENLSSGFRIEQLENRIKLIKSKLDSIDKNAQCLNHQLLEFEKLAGHNCK